MGEKGKKIANIDKAWEREKSRIRKRTFRVFVEEVDRGPGEGGEKKKVNSFFPQRKWCL